jgi:hypothetical protein
MSIQKCASTQGKYDQAEGRLSKSIFMLWAVGRSVVQVLGQKKMVEPLSSFDI